MYITLRGVTEHNYETVCELHIPDEQQKHLARNVYSLVEAHYEGHQARAIYVEEELVGFIMGGYESEGQISIWRFMVAFEHQGKGIGRKALELAIDEISAVDGITKIGICYSPNNAVAKSLYASLGFREIGLNEKENEMLAVIELDPGK